MAYLLAIESSGSIGSVALFDDSRLVQTLIIREERAHSRRLAGMIRELLATNSVSFSQLSAVGVSSGPGSYTGLRIGVSLAKGLCYTLNIPLIGTDTLMIMTKAVSDMAVDAICPMIDARRMEVYTALIGRHGEYLMNPQPMVLEQYSFTEYLDEMTILFIGDGATKAKEVIESPGASFMEDGIAMAENMGELMFHNYEQGIFEDLVGFEPEYLKPVHTTKPKQV